MVPPIQKTRGMVAKNWGTLTSHIPKNDTYNCGLLSCFVTRSKHNLVFMYLLHNQATVGLTRVKYTTAHWIH